MSRPAYVAANPRTMGNEIRSHNCKKETQVLTLKCGHDAPDDDQRWQKKPRTNLLENETARELCSDIWPRFVVLTSVFKTFRRRHTRKRW